MLQEEHPAILSTFIKLPFVIKIFALSNFERLFYTSFTVTFLPFCFDFCSKFCFNLCSDFTFFNFFSLPTVFGNGRFVIRSQSLTHVQSLPCPAEHFKMLPGACLSKNSKYAGGGYGRGYLSGRGIQMTGALEVGTWVP